MCGIAGLVGFGPDGRQNIERMKARMAHRGPDADGTWVSEDGGVVLGHQRLAIRDLSAAGAQPFVSASGRSVIVYNGEIYNGDEVKRALADAGWRGSFRSTCDTEVLIEACEWLGVERTLKLCRGMFAFGLFDLEHGTLTLARDRAGEKPLYYGCVTNPDGKAAFAFASDLGSIAAIEGFSAPVDRGVLDIYFEHGYIPAPYSIYEGIRKLVPGTILTVKLGARAAPRGTRRQRRNGRDALLSRPTGPCGRRRSAEESIPSRGAFRRHHRSWSAGSAKPSAASRRRTFRWARSSPPGGAACPHLYHRHGGPRLQRGGRRSQDRTAPRNRTHGAQNLGEGCEERDSASPGDVRRAVCGFEPDSDLSGEPAHEAVCHGFALRGCRRRTVLRIHDLCLGGEGLETLSAHTASAPAGRRRPRTAQPAPPVPRACRGEPSSGGGLPGGYLPALVPDG